MWRRWSLRAKIVAVTMGVVLPVIVVTTALGVRMSRAALEDDLQEGGIALARELAASFASAGEARGRLVNRRGESC